MFDGQYTGYFDGTCCASEMRWIGVEQKHVDGILLERSNWLGSGLVKNGGFIDNKSAKEPKHNELKSCEASQNTKTKIITTHHPSKSSNKQIPSLGTTIHKLPLPYTANN